MSGRKPHQIAHALAARAAIEFVRAAAEAGLSWTDIASVAGGANDLADWISKEQSA